MLVISHLPHPTVQPRFTLQERRWYACEFIGDEFAEDECSYSPIRVAHVEPRKSGDGSFLLDFYHANYPSGVRAKRYLLRTIERGASFLLARSLEHVPVRLLQIYEIDADWVSSHFPGLRVDASDVQGWLDRNATLD
jgi:hypothetical protein